MIVYPDTAQAGQPFHVNARELAIGNGQGSSRAWQFWEADPLPEWLTGVEPVYGGFNAAEGTPTEAGTVSLPVSHTAYQRDEAIVSFTVEDPVTDPDPDPGSDGYEGYLDVTAGRVARMVGSPQRPGKLETARDAVEIVTGYVRGYVRALDDTAGRGFSAEGVPNKDVTAVVVMAAVRVAANPRQVTYYQTGDYSERPAVMAGWTAAEVSTLRRYRKRQA